MSILSKMKALPIASNEAARVPMTKEQIEMCKKQLRKDQRGYNVQPNTFDIATPYRVAINYDNAWGNFGNFKSVDVAAAVGSIVAAAYFGDKAVAGVFDEVKVENDPEFLEWMADERNVDVIARANGDKPSHQDEKNSLREKCNADMASNGVNPFAADADDDKPF